MREAARKRMSGKVDPEPASPTPAYDDIEPVVTSSESPDAGMVVDGGAIWRYFLRTAVHPA